MANSERSAGRRFDRDHSVTTQAVLFLSELDPEAVADGARAHATHYEAVPVADFCAMLAQLPEAVVKASTFVDIGAGMGRALLLASEYPFKQIVGIELSPGLHQIAKANLAQVRGLRSACRDVRLSLGDARHRRYPRGDLVVFLYNPFDGEALRLTLERVLADRKPADRIHLLYHTPVHRHVLDEFASVTIAELPCGVIVRLGTASLERTASATRQAFPSTSRSRCE